MDKQEMVRAMQQAIDACGVNVITDRGRFRSCLTDFLHDKAARAALLTAQDADVCADFLGVHRSTDAEHNRVIGVAYKRLTGEYGLSAERSILILEVYAEGLGWKNYILPSAPSAAPAPQPVAPVAQPTGAAQPDMEEVLRQVLAIVSQQKTGQQPAAAPAQQPTAPTPSPKGPSPGISIAPTVGSTIRFGPYDWRVLTVENGKALLITEDIVKKQLYHVSIAKTDWKRCSLNLWLNEVFYKKRFSKDERTCIVSGNGKNQRLVFLLSEDDIRKYYPGLKRKNTNSDKSEICYEPDERLVASLVVPNGKQAHMWWLQQSSFAGEAPYVDSVGSVHIFHGERVNNTEGGVRPALWLNLL